jgi:DNA polymerase V
LTGHWGCEGRALSNSPHDKKEPFYGPSLGRRLPHQTNDTAELIKHACTLLAAMHRPGLAYVKCGVILAELSPQDQAQTGLFDRLDTARSSRLMEALDRINANFGRGPLVYAGSGSRDWKGAASMESNHFTPDWRQVLRVHE